MTRSPMLRIGVRTLAAHKLRLALTVISVVLGTAFITGAMVFTQTLSAAFDDVVAGEYAGVDVVVEAGPGAGLDEAAIADIAGTPGVRAVRESTGLDAIVLTGADGTRLRTPASPQGRPAQRTWLDGSPVVYDTGSAPEGPEEVALDRRAAEAGGAAVGDRITVVTARDRAELTVSGVFRPRPGSTRPLAAVDPALWRKLYAPAGGVPRLLLGVDGTRSPQRVAAAIAAAHPDAEVTTGADRVAKSSADTAEQLDFVNYFLVAFGLIGLVTGAFIIANTFAMLVAQRIREFALLRAIGAARAQLTRSVLAESALVGLVGSVLGVAAGFGLVRVLTAVLEATLGMPAPALAWSPAAILAPAAAGVAITVLGAWAPAHRAGAVPPVAAMRAGDAAAAPLRARTLAGAACLAITLVAVAVALGIDAEETKPRAILVGVGALAALLAAWLAGPALARIGAAGIGRVLGAPFGAVGRLAATNSRRNPRRAAATAFALTLGLALVTSVGMLGASMKEFTTGMLDEDFRADLIVSAPMTSEMPLPDGVRAAVADVDGITGAASFALAPVAVLDPGDAERILAAAAAAGYGPGAEPAGGAADPGGDAGAAGRPPSGMGGLQPFFDGDLGRWYSLHATAGSLDLGAPDAGVVINERTARDNGWTLGSDVTVLTPTGPVATSVTGVHDGETAPVMIARGVLGGARPAWLGVREIYLSVAGGADAGDAPVPAGVRAAVEDAADPFLIPEVRDRAEYADQVSGGIDRMLAVVYALLGLAIVISVLGILNTLALSVIERRREIGMLRAIGMQRSGLRTMVVLESVQVALFGAVLGMGLGLALGWAFLRVVFAADAVIAVPWGLLAVTFAGAAAAGVVAAAWPAARAAKVPPLAAMAED